MEGIRASLVEIENIIDDYKRQISEIELRDESLAIAEKVRQYESDLRKESESRKAGELREMEIAIEAVGRVKTRLEKAAQETGQPEVY